MALDLGTLLVKLGIDTAQFNASIIKAQANMTKVSDAMEKTGSTIAKAGESATEVGTTISKYVTLPMAAMAAVTTKAAINFESAFAGVRKTVDATEEQFKEMESAVKDMTKQLPATTTEISAVAEAAGQLGIKREAIMTFTETMVKLGSTTNLTSEQAATAFARIGNIMQVAQEDFSRMGAAVVALGNDGASTEQDIVSMAMRIAGAGKVVGISTAQVLGFANALSSVGIEAEAGGTAISRVMVEITNEVKSSGKNLELYAAVAGKSAADFKKAFEADAAGAIVTFVEGLGRMQEAGQNVFPVLENLGLADIRVRDALLRASGAGDLFRKSIELGSKAWAENTALNIEAEKRYKTTASQLEIVRNRLNLASISIGTGLATALKSLLTIMEPTLKSLENAATRFAELDTAAQGNIIKWGLVVAAIGPAILVMGKVVTVIGTLIAAGSKLVFAFNAMSAGAATLGEAMTFALGPVGIAVTVLAAVVGGIVLFTSATKKAREEAAKQDAALTSLRKRYDDVESTLADTTKTEAEWNEAALEQKKLIKEIGDLFPGLVKRWDEHGNAVEIDTKALRANARAAEENGKKQAEAAVEKARATVVSLNKQRDELQASIADVVANGAKLTGGGYTVDITNSTIATLNKQLDEVNKKIGTARGNYGKLFAEVNGASAEDELQPDTTLSRRRQAAQAEITTAAEQTSQTEISIAGDTAEAKQTYLDEFETAFSRSQDSVMTKFSRDQEDQTTLFRQAQDEQLAQKRASLDKQMSDYQDHLDGLATKFAIQQEDEKIKFESDLRDRRDAKKDALDKEYRDYKDTLDKQYDALRDAFDRESDLRQSELDAKRDPLRARISAIQLAQEQEEQARKVADMTQRVADAQADLNDARLKGDPKDIAAAQKRLTEVLRDQADMTLRDARRAEIDKLQLQIKGLEDSKDLEDKAAEKRLKADQENMRVRNEGLLRDKQVQLEIEMKGFEDILAQDQLNFKRRQDSDATRFKQDIEFLAQQNKDLLAEELRKFQLSQAQAETEWKRQQEDQATRYKDELEDLKISLNEKLAEQAAFVTNWNAMANKMAALAPAITQAPAAPTTSPVPATVAAVAGTVATTSSPASTTPAFNGDAGKVSATEQAAAQSNLTGFDLAKSLAKSGDVVGAAQVLVNAFGLSVSQAMENIKSAIPSLGTGGIAIHPTFAEIGERGPEAIVPLSRMGSLLGGGMSERGQLAMASVGGGSPSWTVYIGERQIYDIVVAANEDATRRGRR